eukprot:scaffold3854_cov107-Isochrysis_galbana.AAC.5
MLNGSIACSMGVWLTTTKIRHHSRIVLVCSSACEPPSMYVRESGWARASGVCLRVEGRLCCRCCVTP